MEKIIALSETSPQMVDTKEGKFLSFMIELPIWELYKISQSVYLNHTKEKKSKMISEYYRKMSEGKIVDLFFCLFLFCLASDIWQALKKTCVCLSVKPNAYMFDSPAPSGRANILSLSRELTEADRSVRSQIVVANLGDSSEKRASECIWQENGFFGELKADFSIHKKDFSENALIYINQAYLSSKDGEPVVYCDYAIVSQLITLKTVPDGLDEAVRTDRSLVKMYDPDYDHKSGKFLGVKESLGYIMLRNKEQETFFTYGFSAEHASILYCYSRQSMPNVFKGTAFITDRKEGINRYRDQVALVPVTCTSADISKFSPEGYEFNPSDLDKDAEEEACCSARQTMYEIFKNAVKFSNSNLTQNVYALIKSRNIDQAALKWASSMAQSKVHIGKFSTSF